MVSAGSVRRLGPSVSPGNRIPMREKRTGSVRITTPKKLINTVECPSHAAVIWSSLQADGFGRAEAGAIRLFRAKDLSQFRYRHGREHRNSHAHAREDCLPEPAQRAKYRLYHSRHTTEATKIFRPEKVADREIEAHPILRYACWRAKRSEPDVNLGANFAFIWLPHPIRKAITQMTLLSDART